MAELCKRNNCCGCGACAEICPKNAIALKKDEMGFSYPEINRDLCVECHLCEKLCRVFDDTSSLLNASNEYFAYQSARKICLGSSSGGICHELSQIALSKGYAVCGAVYVENFSSVKFAVAQTEKELEQFRNSKYVAVDMGDIYSKVYGLLHSNQNVLFFGLPCHIGGLKAYLKSRKNTAGQVHTVDLICHGVGSPHVWNLALDEFCVSKGAQRKDLKMVNFRSKPEIDGKRLLLLLQDTSYFIAPKDFPYYFGFENRLLMRDSCYACKYRSTERPGDITVGDMLPIDPEGFGRSVVLVNTERGRKLTDELAGDAVPLTDDEITSLKKRICGAHSGTIPKFKEKVRPKDGKDYKKLSKTYLNPAYIPFKYRIKRIIKKLLKNKGEKPWDSLQTKHY